MGFLQSLASLQSLRSGLQSPSGLVVQLPRGFRIQRANGVIGADLTEASRVRVQ